MALYVRRPGPEQLENLPAEPQPFGIETSPEGHGLWEEFVAAPSMGDVYSLWRDTTIRPDVRQRAIAVLTAPTTYNLPYGTPPQQGIERLLHLEEEVNGERTTSLRKRLADNPQLAHECAAGVLYWLRQERREGAEQIWPSRASYGQAARELLPLVDGLTADELFVECIAYTPRSPDEIAADYQPLAELVADGEMPVKYRHAAFDTWLAMLDNEIKLSGVAGLQVESLVRPLAAAVEMAAHTNRLDDAMFCGAVAYLESRVAPGQVYVQGYNVSSIAWTIVDNDLRYDFACRHLRPQSDPYRAFRIRTEGDMALVKWLTAVTHQRGMPAFAQRAAALMDEYRQWLRGSAYQLGLKADLLQRMRQH